ncbi:hypothetical protein Acr_05g0009530 [Actinidia rufa]|uniref:CCHC-type domain-containing protein n=1 Tax=Actinidia rufa TaxID=165716 RepID=A0A7J0ELH6_9ERIC|nr:hypothetical protein Acr_05g0009530 [Actinidia rufa]
MATESSTPPSVPPAASMAVAEDNRNYGKKGKKPMVAKANVVEHGGTSNSKKRKHTDQGSKQGPKGGGNKKAKFQGKCFKCDKIGHRAAECRSKPKDEYANKKPAQANMNEVEDLSDGISDMHLSVVVSEVNMINPNPKECGWTLALLVISIRIKGCTPLTMR